MHLLHVIVSHWLKLREFNCNNHSRTEKSGIKKTHNYLAKHGFYGSASILTIFSWKLTLDHFISNLNCQCDHCNHVPAELIYFSETWPDHHLIFSETWSLKSKDNFSCSTFTRCNPSCNTRSLIQAYKQGLLSELILIAYILHCYCILCSTLI